MKENDDNCEIIKQQGTKITKIVYALAGANHSLAIISDGRVLSWGYNGYQILGRNTGPKKEKDNLTCLPLPLFTDLRPNKKKTGIKSKKRNHQVMANIYTDYLK